MKELFAKSNVVYRGVPVYQYDKDRNLIAIWRSAYDVKLFLGFDNGNISRVCMGKAATAYGYVWSFEPLG